MPLLEDFLLRFRRVWAPPGPVAGQAGVPQDLAATIEDELRDLSLELETIDTRGREIVREAEAESDAIAASALNAASKIVETARERAPAVRAASAAARVRDRADEIDSLLARAAQDAQSMRDRAGPRMDPVVRKVVERVLAAPAISEAGHARVVGRR